MNSTTSPQGSKESQPRRWVSELDQRLLSSLRQLKMENAQLRDQVKRLQESLGEAQGARERLAEKSSQLESQLAKTQTQTRETALEVQWLLSQSQEVLELRHLELKRLRSELEAAHSKLQLTENTILVGNFPRKKVMPPRNLAAAPSSAQTAAGI